MTKTFFYVTVYPEPKPRERKVLAITYVVLADSEASAEAIARREWGEPIGPQYKVARVSIDPVEGPVFQVGSRMVTLAEVRR